jgi:hypothetical protein
MFVLELLVFMVGVAYFWLRTEATAEEGLEELPHLDVGSRFHPR